MHTVKLELVVLIHGCFTVALSSAALMTMVEFGCRSTCVAALAGQGFAAPENRRDIMET